MKVVREKGVLNSEISSSIYRRRLAWASRRTRVQRRDAGSFAWTNRSLTRGEGGWELNNCAMTWHCSWRHCWRHTDVWRAIVGTVGWWHVAPVHVSRLTMMVTRGTAHVSKVKLLKFWTVDWVHVSRSGAGWASRRRNDHFALLAQISPFCPQFVSNASQTLFICKITQNTSKRSQNSRNYTKY